MKDQPCNVCGSLDLNLIDGFYYCVECGTQDVNVRETIVEQTYLADGTLALVGGKKFTTTIKDGMRMSGEWHKWHAYNFILAGLTEELIKLGAKPSVKIKVLWIWVRYIQKFQVKEDLEVKSKIGNETLRLCRLSNGDSGNSEPEDDSVTKQKKGKSEKFTKDVKIVTKGLLLAILYVALNLDKSNIQLSHLFRFIKEGRLSFLNCNKYIPKEIDTKTIPHFKSFSLCQSDYNSHTIRAYAMTCIKALDLGLPVVPDMNKIINNYIKDLCLPNDFKNLVLSLMLYHPCDHLDIDKVTQKVLVRVPDYEGVAMSYVLVALKMCFGLDGEYEELISDAVDKVNYDESCLKSHKLGMFSDRSDRLFSFREWVKYLQLRKTVLSQYYLPMARQYNQQVDDYVLMEQLEERITRPIKLRDEVTMDILNKITLKNNISVIPKSEFVACLTPVATYTDVILNYVRDNELRLLLSEDFSQYSLEYAIENLTLKHFVTDENLVVGVSENYKIIEPKIEVYFDSKKGDMTMVFVRNCENKNWLKTNPPKVEHITKVSENETCESDHGYDSNIESSPIDPPQVFDEDFKPERFEEEKEKSNIFDDNFLDLLPEKKSEPKPMEEFEFDNFNNSQIEIPECFGKPDGEVDLSSFDKTKMIEELVALACRKYRINLPKPFASRPKKRKIENTNEEDAQEPKIKRNKDCSAKAEIKDMVAAYQSHVDNCDFANVLKSLHDPDFDVIDLKECIQPDNIETLNDAEENIDLNEISPTLQNTIEPQEEEPTDNDNMLDILIDDTPQATGDENFDEKTHNIAQLYVKLKEDVAIDDFGMNEMCDDPELDKILMNKIEQSGDCDKEVCIKNKIECSHSDDDDCEEIQDIEYKEVKREVQIEHFEPLVKPLQDMKTFKYWVRHYNSRSMGKNLDMHQKFDMELKRKCPASFNLIINECAAILGCSVYSLYKGMQNLEETIIAKSKRTK